MNQVIYEVHDGLSFQVSRILKLLSFILGYLFSQLRKLGEMASQMIDQAAEGYQYGTYTIESA